MSPNELSDLVEIIVVVAYFGESVSSSCTKTTHREAAHP